MQWPSLLPSFELASELGHFQWQEDMTLLFQYNFAQFAQSRNEEYKCSSLILFWERDKCILYGVPTSFRCGKFFSSTWRDINKLANFLTFWRFLLNSYSKTVGTPSISTLFRPETSFFFLLSLNKQCQECIGTNSFLRNSDCSHFAH